MARTKAEPLSSAERQAQTEAKKTGKVMPPPDTKNRKKRRHRPGVVAERNIKKYQLRHPFNTKLLIKKAPMSRLCREVLQNINIGRGDNVADRFQRGALNALHIASEQMLTECMEDCALYAKMRNEKTIRKSDMTVAQHYDYRIHHK